MPTSRVPRPSESASRHAKMRGSVARIGVQPGLVARRIANACGRTRKLPVRTLRVALAVPAGGPARGRACPRRHAPQGKLAASWGPSAHLSRRCPASAVPAAAGRVAAIAGVDHRVTALGTQADQCAAFHRGGRDRPWGGRGITGDRPASAVAWAGFSPVMGWATLLVSGVISSPTSQPSTAQITSRSFEPDGVRCSRTTARTSCLR